MCRITQTRACRAPSRPRHDALSATSNSPGPGTRRAPARFATGLAATLLLGLCASAQAAQRPFSSGARASAGSSISSANVARLRVAWRYEIPTRDTFSGVVTSPPVVVRGVLYLQDMRSNVRALDAATGHVRWTRHFGVEDGGPNGIAVSDGRVFGNTDTTAFALDSSTGRVVWRHRLTTTSAQHVNIAPVVANGLVYTSVVGLPPGGKGTIYALDRDTGRLRWRFATIRGNWAVPREAGGGGLWWPVSVDAQGRVYAGVSNPYPWGGTKAHPNGGAYRGDALYTDSLLVLDGRTGTLLWYDQVVAHDVRDYDFAETPVLATLAIAGRQTDVVFGAGKGGRVIAWNRATHRRLWATEVGIHLHDKGPLPPKPVTVCPGLLGGVVTPMAYAGGRAFVPVVNLCMQGSAIGYPQFLTLDYSKGTGELVALDARSGARLWRHTFRSPVFGCATASRDLVFTATYDGRVYALAASSGRILWTARTKAGINSCPTVHGDQLLVGAGADPFSIATPVHELIAYRLPAR
jgi:alcohol dehydrogenase (cytochrome c)